MKKVFLLVAYFIPSALIVTLFSGAIYVVGHQSLRQSANDPQIQIAEDMADSLEQGATPNELISRGIPADVSRHLSTFAVIFDESEKIVATTATLGGKPITFPKGVLAYAKEHGSNRITWEPQAGVRSAVVIEHYKSAKGSGFVVVGRSLREIENRIHLLEQFMVGVWVVGLVLSIVAFYGMMRACRLQK